MAYMDSHETDELWMVEALREAQRALEDGEVPVGAVVVLQGTIVGRGRNRNIITSDPSAHAEIVALREAGKTVGNHRLGDCELFATIEPCAMCAGAMIHARIKRLIYGSDDPKAVVRVAERRIESAARRRAADRHGVAPRAAA